MSTYIHICLIVICYSYIYPFIYIFSYLNVRIKLLSKEASYVCMDVMHSCKRLDSIPSCKYVPVLRCSLFHEIRVWTNRNADAHLPLLDHTYTYLVQEHIRRYISTHWYRCVCVSVRCVCVSCLCVWCVCVMCVCVRVSDTAVHPTPVSVAWTRHSSLPYSQ